MGKVTVLPETTKNPITLIGMRAGVCWGANIDDEKLNYKRGLDCISSDHGRCLEYVNVETVLDGYSARVIREWYTHIGGSPTRLQESTRYVNCKNFKYVTPERVASRCDALDMYARTMRFIMAAVDRLESMGIPREDAAMLLPLGMATKIVDKRNLRNLADMSRNRKCSRAYWEYRELFRDLEKALSEYSDEWATLVEMLFKPKCEILGYCPEKNGCGRAKKGE